MVELKKSQIHASPCEPGRLRRDLSLSSGLADHPGEWPKCRPSWLWGRVTLRGHSRFRQDQDAIGAKETGCHPGEQDADRMGGRRVISPSVQIGLKYVTVLLPTVTVVGTGQRETSICIAVTLVLIRYISSLLRGEFWSDHSSVILWRCAPHPARGDVG